MQLLNVLYVEDRPVNIMLMRAVFQRCPQFRLSTASSCYQALQLARHHVPALLLLDLDLPDGHGNELLQQLRGLPGYDQVPAVAVTADQQFETAGTTFCELWLKPLDLGRVLQRLHDLAATGSLSGGLATRMPAAQTASAAA
jgi:CheY-like chemotaxis protein